MLFPLTDKLLTLVVAKVEVPVTFKLLLRVKEVAEALPKDEVAVAMMEVNDGLAEIVIWVEVPTKTFWPPAIFKLAPTVRLARVLVPMPPRTTGKTPALICEASIAMEALPEATTSPNWLVVNTGTWEAEP